MKIKMANSNYQPIKRILDILLSIIFLIVLSPLFLIIFLILKITQRGEVFYFQDRAGLFSKKFKIIKFRTMIKEADEYLEKNPKEYEIFVKNGFKFPAGADPRVTKVGNFLRKTSLDEIPQFVNILIGDMSIIGPRPITFKELKLYKKNSSKLLSTRPGAMGLWQANGRSNVSYNQRMNLELNYVDNISFSNDVKIFFKSILSILKQEGAA